MEQRNPEDIQTVIAKMLRDETFRKALVTRSLFWFSHFYFPNALQLPTADFQKEIMSVLESDRKGWLLFPVFRGGGKSTIAERYILFATLARREKKFVVIASRTERQAEEHLMTIKRELEDPANILLLKDFGPIKEDSDEWGRRGIVFPRCGARITVLSVGQSLRGMKYREHRPDLTILDDIEDSTSIATLESRDKTYRWMNEDVIPAGGENLRVIFLGTPLHDDSAMMRMKSEIVAGRITGLYREYPILDEEGNIAWPGKYPSMEKVEEEKLKYSERAWRQEFELDVVYDEERVIDPAWIRYYKRLLDTGPWTGHRFRIISIDPAVSEKQSADCTAIVSAEIYGSGDKIKIFVLPNPVKKVGMSAKEMVECVKALRDQVDYMTKVVIESVGAQMLFVQILNDNGVWNVIATTPGRMDKRTRLAGAGYQMQSGHVYFPETGAETLVSQLINFGRTRYDDIADAFSQLVLNAAELSKKGFVIPVSHYPESTYLPRYLTGPETAEELRKKAEREADLELIHKDERERRAM